MKFRLNAGKPATPARGGPSAPPEEIKVRKYWAPNTEPPTLLECGDSIPWPILRIMDGGPVWCDQHGWQKVAGKEDPRCKTQSQSTLPDLPPF